MWRIIYVSDIIESHQEILGEQKDDSKMAGSLEDGFREVRVKMIEKKANIF